MTIVGAKKARDFSTLVKEIGFLTEILNDALTHTEDMDRLRDAVSLMYKKLDALSPFIHTSQSMPR